MVFLVFLIFEDEQPLLPVVVLPGYIFGTPPAAVPSPAVLERCIFRCFFFSARGKLISCPFSLLPPRLLVSPAALVTFRCPYFGRLGPAFKYDVLKFIVQLAAVLLHFISLLGLSRFMKGHVYQELTLNEFIHLVVALNNFLCRYFCRLRPPF